MSDAIVHIEYSCSLHFSLKVRENLLVLTTKKKKIQMCMLIRGMGLFGFLTTTNKITDII